MREYLVYVPERLDTTAPAPLVLDFHGLGSDMESQALDSGFRRVAEREGFILVHPNGLPNRDGSRSWNGGLCCALDDPDRDDVDFVRQLVADLSQKACVDAKRIYVTGMSNGGHLSYRLACQAVDLVAAAAPVAGTLLIPPEACRPTRPVPVMHIHGTDDELVPYEGGLTPRGLHYPSVKRVIATWRARNGCGQEVKRTRSTATAHCMTNVSCKQGAEVTLCTINGMGHCWPGLADCLGGGPAPDFNAAQIIWRFFSRHRLR